nr:PREDICTED: protein stum [Megachile rotundata]
MRRIDDGHVARPPPFRVLAAPDNYLSPPTLPPPPPRAPEPYKVAPSSTSSSRAHRRSSFVIIADSRPASPETRTPSPTLAAGRVSPFRGRGFKGPPPRSKSRPQSPEVNDARRRGRNDRRVSVSQQSSPRRSLIPQPTRQRSTSLGKSNERLSSPKIGRRVDSRTRLNTTESRNRLNAYSGSKTNLATRRQVTKTGSKLSPIQGTPTKPEKTPQSTRRDRPRETKASPTRQQKSPSRNPRNPKRPSQEKTPASKERLTSPSKIPLKTNRVNSLNPARFITLNQPGDKKKVDKGSKDVQEQPAESGQSSKSEAGSKESEKNSDQVGELNLIDLLKQTSGATGTSSVVNTTATTAVQPLHIDANAVLLEKDSDKKSPNQDPASGKSSTSSNEDIVTRQTSVTNDDRPKASKANNHRKGTESRTDSPVPSEKNSTKNASKISATKTDSAKTRNAPNDQTSVSKNQKMEESGSVQSATTNSAKSSEVELVHDSTKSQSHEGHRTVVTIASATPRDDPKPAPKSANNSETKSVTNSATMKSNVVETKNNVSVTVGAVNNDAKNVNSAGVKPRTANHGSGASVKSSAGVSIESIESVRSTDTGVSVDTVKGVSSPREKTGMHVVKRAQEIETLSGNVVHLEQNGEPAVLAAANGVGERPPERLLTRWKRSLDRCGECCRSMRCLACRTNPKGLAWPGKHARTTTIKRNEQLPANAASDNAPPGCWPRFKNRCRCKRLREMKCCSRKSRIAPAEATACCPPERKFGAICRRLFDSCKCKRNAEAERTRNIRAKHSLTSVAPPPLSEEPKAKIPDVLVEHNSLMRGAIPCLPVPLAWFCLVWNVLLPGSGTVWSGIFNLCTGQPRFSSVAGVKSRLGAFVVNLMVGVGQLFTVLFCLVGWGWSIWWGVTLVRLARKYKRFKASEAAINDPEARGEPAALPPGVPSHALRGMERTR